MRNIAVTLRARLVLASVALVVISLLAALAVSVASARQFADELSQRLNRNIAMYVAARGPLANPTGLNTTELQQIAEQARIFNPSISLYLVNETGLVVWSDDAALTHARRVALDPIRAALNDPVASLPLYGDDPGRPGRRALISVNPVALGPEGSGYIYATLETAVEDPWWVSVFSSYVLRWSITVIVAVGLLAALTAVLVTRWLTDPLRALRTQVAQGARDLGVDEGDGPIAPGDEIEGLRRAFAALTARIQVQVQELRSTDRLRRELFAHISHDLRSPLTAMRGYLETLSVHSQQLSRDRQLSFIQIVRKHNDRLIRLVEQVFLLARLDAAALPIQWERVAMADLAQDILSKWRLMADRRGIRLSLERGDDLPLVYADIGLMETVLENLLDNSLRHSSDGGEIVVSLWRGGQGVIVSVRDRGSGLDPAVLPRAQEPFVAGAGGRSGLGLAIVGRVLRLHDAQLELRSESGAGTTVSFSLPMQPPRAA